MIDFEKEFFHLLENNSLTTLPSQELIDSNPRVAKEVWRNFHSEDAIEYDDWNAQAWYREGKWAVVLAKYATDTAFWDELVKELPSYRLKNIISELFTGQFRQDFPVIAKHFFENNDSLLWFFNATSNMEFYEALDLPAQEKTILHKKFLLEHKWPGESDVKKYEGDTEFVMEMLKKYPYNFCYLSEENKNNRTYIELALETKETFFNLNREQQHEFYPLFMSKYEKGLMLSDIKRMDYSLQKKTLLVHPHMLDPLLYQNHEKYLPIGIDLLRKDFVKNLQWLKGAQVIRIVKEAGLLEDIRPALESFVDNYYHTSFSPQDEVMLELLDNKLKNKLQTNLFYQISLVDKQGKKKKKDWFFEMAHKVMDMYNEQTIDEETAQMTMNKVRNCLDVATLQELRIPNKNFFNHVKSLLQVNELQEQLPQQESNGRRMKI